MERDHASDVAKGIGVYLVILGHLAVSYGRSFLWIFSFHMPLFFFMSGYFFVPEQYDFVALVRKKLKTLIFPYFIFLGIGAIVVKFVNAWSIHDFSNPYWLMFYMGQPEPLRMGQLWFLLALFWSTLMFYVLYMIGHELPDILKTVLFVALAFLATKMTEQFMFPIYGRFPLKMDTACVGVIFYGAGYIFRKWKIFDILEKHKYITTVIMFGMVTVLSMWNGPVNMSDCVYSNNYLFYLAAFSGIIMVNMLAKILCKSRILAFYGKNSLPIFALHSLGTFAVLAIFGKFTGQYYGMGGVPFYYSLILSIVVSIIMAPIALLYNYIGKTLKKVLKGGKT